MIKLILKERVENLGRSGDIVNVKNGYARNFLIPKGYAVQANDQSVKYIEHQKRVIQKKVDTEKKDLERVSELINAKTYTVERKLASENKLYGSVTSNDIFELLLADGFKIYKKDVIFESVKQLGDYKAKVDLGHGIKSELTITVKGDDTGFAVDDTDLEEVEEYTETEELLASDELEEVKEETVKAAVVETTEEDSKE